MKFAFLLLCHKNPKQINMLLNKLEEFDCDIYIHIDKKKYLEIIDLISRKGNIYVIEYDESYDIKWGGVEMVSATLSLIEKVRKSGKNYDYLWLLSGQDYIIKNSSYIVENMKKNPNCNYIEIIDKNNKKYNSYKKLYDVYYWNWMTKNKLICKVIKRLYMILTGGFSHTLPIFKRKKPFPFEFYFGSQWWTLKQEVAYQILEYTNNNPRVVDFFKHSIIPDECFFQTIIMSLPYKKTIKNNLTFVNWKNNRRSPETLTINDYNLLINHKKYYFARKFDIDIDQKIIDELNNKLN